MMKQFLNGKYIEVETDKDTFVSNPFHTTEERLEKIEKICNRFEKLLEKLNIS